MKVPLQAVGRPRLCHTVAQHGVQCGMDNSHGSGPAQLIWHAPRRDQLMLPTFFFFFNSNDIAFASITKKVIQMLGCISAEVSQFLTMVQGCNTLYTNSSTLSLQLPAAQETGEAHATELTKGLLHSFVLLYLYPITRNFF